MLGGCGARRDRGVRPRGKFWVLFFWFRFFFFFCFFSCLQAYVALKAGFRMPLLAGCSSRA